MSRKEVEVLKCPKCGADIRRGQEICDYCGAFIVFKDEEPFMLFKSRATDENIEKYIRLVNLQVDHFVKRGGYGTVGSERELAEISYNARDDLREELGYDPLIKQVDTRVGMYLAPKKAAKQMTQIQLQSAVYVIVMTIVGAIFTIIAMWLFF